LPPIAAQQHALTNCASYAVPRQKPRASGVEGTFIYRRTSEAAIGSFGRPEAASLPGDTAGDERQ